MFRQKHLLRPWNPNRGSITDVPGSKQRAAKLSQSDGPIKSQGNPKKRKNKKNAKKPSKTPVKQ